GGYVSCAFASPRRRVHSLVGQRTDTHVRFQVWVQVTEQAAAAWPAAPCDGLLDPKAVAVQSM
ncbi:hypothetical protein R3Q06_36720, partial [Rhodococcus erythropolis]|uniref:hypothetical protein n=1 Tax=Rhodococcus erythropolis TaxID=1833 RepID=UPI002949696A